MSVAYRILYALGVTPWERIGASPAIRAQIASLFERQEDGTARRTAPRSTSGAGAGSGRSSSRVGGGT